MFYKHVSTSNKECKCYILQICTKNKERNKEMYGRGKREEKGYKKGIKMY